MNPLIIGNAISMIGCLIMVLIGFLKKKNHILIAQCVQCLFMGVGNLVLGGVSGFICNIVTIIRNLVFVKFRNTTFLKIFFIVLQLVLSIGTLSAGFIIKVQCAYESLRVVAKYVLSQAHPQSC